MAGLVYVDDSNVFIEGRRVSAVHEGMAGTIFEAMRDNILNPNYSIDLGKLHSFAAGNKDEDIKRAVLFGSKPPENDSLWKVASRCGFEVVLMRRDINNKERKVDTAIVAEMMADAWKYVDPVLDSITLVAGDKDFTPAVERLISDGYRVELIFWEHAAIELKDAVSSFTSLNPFLNMLRYNNRVMARHVSASRMVHLRDSFQS